jgi:hypothetical protein
VEAVHDVAEELAAVGEAKAGRDGARRDH